MVIKPSELTRPSAGPEDFIPVIGVTKEKGNCIEGASSPYVHNDLANGTCYHYVVTAVTADGESPESEEIAIYAHKVLHKPPYHILNFLTVRQCHEIPDQILTA